MDEMNASGIMRRLATISSDILTAEIAVANSESGTDDRHLRELKESLEIAEVNAALNAPDDGKNEKARDLARKAFITSDVAVKAAKLAISQEEASLAESKVNTKIAQAKRAALRAEVDSLKEIAGLMREKMAMERAKLDLQTAQVHIELAHSQETILAELKGQNNE